MFQIKKYEYRCNWKELELVLNNLELIMQVAPKHVASVHADSAIHFLKLVARRIDNTQDEYRDFIKSLIKKEEK